MTVLITIGIVLLVVLRLVTLLPSMAVKGERFPKKWRLWALGESRDGKAPKSENVIMPSGGGRIMFTPVARCQTSMRARWTMLRNLPASS
jgi:hypothetical protein